MKYLQLVKAIDSASQQLLGRAAAVINQSLVIRNWLIGAYIVEFEQSGADRAKYGEHLYLRLATDLNRKGVKGCGERMLQQMSGLYRIYPQISGLIPQSLIAELPAALKAGPITKSRRRTTPSIPQSVIAESARSFPAGISSPSAGRPSGGVTPLSASTVLQFSWTQLIEFIRIDEPLKRAFYENECLKGNWSVRQLQRQKESLLFERTALSKSKAVVIKRAQAQASPATIADLIRDPYVLEFTGLAELPQYTENDLESALLDHLQKFLLELGAGFLFEARQRRITVGNAHDHIDLVFYHRHLRCHVLLDLKIRAFHHGDAGQMNFYLNWWRANITAPDEQPPVGMILCSDKDHTKVQFATAGMDNQLFVSRYLTALPSVEQLQRFVKTDRDRIEAVTEPAARVKSLPPARRRRRTPS